MNTYYIVIDDKAKTHFSGSLDECSREVRTLMDTYPTDIFHICKVSPVSRHDFPTRRMLSM